MARTAWEKKKEKKFGVNRLDGLLVGYLIELRATHSDPSKCRRQISSFAKTLTVRVATYLAKEIAALLYHPLMSLTEDGTLPSFDLRVLGAPSI